MTVQVNLVGLEATGCVHAQTLAPWLDPGARSGTARGYLRDLYRGFRPTRDAEAYDNAWKGEVMPQILIEADRRADGDSNTIVYRERINLSDLESDHFSGQLVERVGWAVLDADELERGEGTERRRTD